jgi:hypothetical protein
METVNKDYCKILAPTAGGKSLLRLRFLNKMKRYGGNGKKFPNYFRNWECNSKELKWLLVHDNPLS